MLIFSTGEVSVPEEAEYLFAPYSVFTVVDVTWSPTPDDRTPHRVTLQALTDNREKRVQSIA